MNEKKGPRIKRKRAVQAQPGKLAGALAAVSLGQFLVGLFLLFHMRDRLLGEAGPVFLLCIGLILLASLIFAAGFLALGRWRDRGGAQVVKDLEQANESLREQKHDMMNHFQIVYGLMELGEYEEARAYISPVCKQIQKSSRAMRTSQPAVNALLQAKMETAEQMGIDFYPEVGSALERLPMKAWDFCRILANLLDNATAALQEQEGERRITVRIWEDREDYLLEVENNGPPIPEEILPAVFCPGVTTKKEEGHGLGLAIVARLVRECGGQVTAESVEGMTSFLVRLPKAKN